LGGGGVKKAQIIRITLKVSKISWKKLEFQHNLYTGMTLHTTKEVKSIATALIVKSIATALIVKSNATALIVKSNAIALIVKSNATALIVKSIATALIVKSIATALIVKLFNPPHKSSTTKETSVCGYVV
jgi:hypothetical protein